MFKLCHLVILITNESPIERYIKKKTGSQLKVGSVVKHAASQTEIDHFLSKKLYPEFTAEGNNQGIFLRDVLLLEIKLFLFLR